MKRLIKITSLLSILLLSACSKPIDLDAPCPNYGKYCPQMPINAWDNDEKQQ